MAQRKKSPAASKHPSSDPAAATSPSRPAEAEADPELTQARAQVATTVCPGCEQAGTRVVEVIEGYVRALRISSSRRAS